MKKYIIIVFIALISFSCEDYLDVVPDNVATLDHAFQDRTTTLRYLATCYSYMPEYQHLFYNPAQSASDEFYVDPNPFYGTEIQSYGRFVREGKQTAEDPYFNDWNHYYDAIRVCNTFLKQAPNVGADLTNAEKSQWIGEVKFLKAFYHFQLMKQYGAVPVIKENLPVDVNIEKMRPSREPYDSSVAYLVKLLDEAIEVLPAEVVNISTDAGHITQPIAATLKAEILITAASPLYNGNPDLASMRNNDGTALYSESFDQNKWTLAAEASKQALDYALAAGHSFYHITEYPNISEETKVVLNRKQAVIERWNSEIIFTTNDYIEYVTEYATPFFSKEQHKSAKYPPHVSPTFATTKFFYSNNGVPIDEDITYPYEQRYDVVHVPEDQKYYAKPGYETMQINLSREPRYYSNLGFDGARWFGNGRYKDVDEGADPDQESYVFKMKAGEEQGKNGAVRFSPTGLWCRKIVHVNSVYTNAGFKPVTVKGTFSFYRLAELYLFYAEALNESLSAPNQQVHQAVDAVREQGGLKGVVESWANFSKFPGKPSTKEGMREIIQQERTSELAFEGKRYYDIRRWKTASKPMNEPIEGFNVNAEETKAYNQIIQIGPQQFFNRDYFSPIATRDLRVNKNLVQNPSW